MIEYAIWLYHCFSLSLRDVEAIVAARGVVVSYESTRGKQHYLWRAIDQGVQVLEILVQSRQSARAAHRFFRKLLRGLQYVPTVIITDKLRNYAAAKGTVLPHVEHRQSKYLNNRIEVSHQPTRRRERQMRRFKSARRAQRFLSTHAASMTTSSSVATD